MQEKYSFDSPFDSSRLYNIMFSLHCYWILKRTTFISLWTNAIEWKNVNERIVKTVFYIFNNIWVGLGQKENMNGQDKAFTKGLILPLPKKLSGTPLFLLYKQYLGQIWLVLEQGGGGVYNPEMNVSDIWYKFSVIKIEGLFS